MARAKFTIAFFRARQNAERAQADVERLSPAKDQTLSIPADHQRWLDAAKTRLDEALAESERVCTPIWRAMREKFDSVNGRASSFTLDAHAALELAEFAEKRLDRLGVPQALRAGCEAWEQSAGPTARAYEYSAIGTRLGLRRDGSGGWELIAVQRTSVRPKQSGRKSLVVTTAAQEAIIRHALEGVEVRAAANASAGEC